MEIVAIHSKIKYTCTYSNISITFTPDHPFTNSRVINIVEEVQVCLILECIIVL